MHIFPPMVGLCYPRETGTDSQSAALKNDQEWQALLTQIAAARP